MSSSLFEFVIPGTKGLKIEVMIMICCGHRDPKYCAWSQVAATRWFVNYYSQLLLDAHAREKL